MRTILALVLGGILYNTSLAHARFLQSMSYDEMMAKSDLVVLAVPYRTTVTQDAFPETTPEQSAERFDAYETYFEVFG